MRDLQIIKVADAIPIHRVSMPSSDTLLLEGERLLGASVVRVNDKEVRYTVISDRLLEATLPAGSSKTPIKSIDVLSDDFTGSTSTKLEFKVGKLRSTKGLLKLIQQFVSLLFTTPGRNIFHKQRGGGLQTLLESNIDPEAPSTYTGVVYMAIDKTAKEIVQSQVLRKLPDEERLKRVSARAVSFDRERASILITLDFETFAGRRALTEVSIS